ncbi:hypothetical protein ACIGFK_26050 [Streptomyces sp. NPDC085524]|uniref:hypothetical protein n=1 Tax=Streptomyces sp. NPDC085524 TaxID=3365728 RepID=UPI0037D52115
MLTRAPAHGVAITTLIDPAQANGCVGPAIENLGFADARATGRATMGRGTRGQTFRRTVALVPRWRSAGREPTQDSKHAEPRRQDSTAPR